MTINLFTLLLILFGVILIIWIEIADSVKEKKKLRLISSVTQANRGTKAERDVIYQLLQYGIPKEDIFHDLYVEHHTGYYSQIDIVAITRYGVLVIEDKDYSGWLFGNGYQQYWTQILNYGMEKHRFYNPVLQNKNHIRHLNNCFTNNGITIPLFSLIVFHKNAVMKDIHDIPSDCHLVYSCNIPKYLKSMESLPVQINFNKQQIREILSSAVRKGANPSVVEKHISNCHYLQ